MDTQPPEPGTPAIAPPLARRDEARPAEDTDPRAARREERLGLLRESAASGDSGTALNAALALFQRALDPPAVQ